MRRLPDVRHHDRLGRRGRVLGRQAHAHHRGGRLARRLRRRKAELETLIDYADQLWLEFGATTDVHGPDPDDRRRARARGDARGHEARADAHPPPRHRPLARRCSTRCASHLEAVGVDGPHRARGRRASSPRTGASPASSSRTAASSTADAVIAAPGREGADWLAEQARALGIELDEQRGRHRRARRVPGAGDGAPDRRALRGQARLPHARRSATRSAPSA